MTRAIRKFLADRRGATSIEYAVMISIFGLSIVVGARVIGSKLSTSYYGILGNNLS